jgi:hypothetical protein
MYVAQITRLWGSYIYCLSFHSFRWEYNQVTTFFYPRKAQFPYWIQGRQYQGLQRLNGEDLSVRVMYFNEYELRF